MDKTLIKILERNLKVLLKKVKHHTIVFETPFVTKLQGYYTMNNKPLIEHYVMSVTLIKDLLRVNTLVYNNDSESTFSLELKDFNLDDRFKILQLSIEAF